MNNHYILYLTMAEINSFSEKGIYSDLAREFICHGDEFYCISPNQNKKERYIFKESNHLLKVNLGNNIESNLFKKGINTILLGFRIKRAVKKFFKHIQFDLILYSTPSISFLKPIKYLKNKNKCKTYLMLKDIFPQNAIDLGLIKKRGFGKIIFLYFKRKEKKFYKISDRIGCMSKANVDYLLKENSFLKKEKLEICPNSLRECDYPSSSLSTEKIRQKFNLPLDKKLFVYGGNFGKPQNVPFIIQCLKASKEIEDCCFVFSGSGTDFSLLKLYEKESKQNNFYIFEKLSKTDFDSLVKSCDVGLIFLDYRFTIPNFPSRLLTYLINDLPVLACTDLASDVGEIIQNNRIGWFCPSNNADLFAKQIRKISLMNLKDYSLLPRSFFIQNYSTKITFKLIKDFLLKNENCCQ